MGELEQVYFVTSAFEGNEEEVSTNYVIEQSTEDKLDSVSVNDDQVSADENGDPDEAVDTVEDEQMITLEDDEKVVLFNKETDGEHEQVIIMKEDGRVVIVNKKGNEGDMIVGSYVQESDITGSEVVTVSEIYEEAEIMDQDDTSHPHFSTEMNSEAEDAENQNTESADTDNENPEPGDKKFSATKEDMTIVQFPSKATDHVKVVRGINKISTLYVDSSGEENTVVDKLTCKYCLKSFTKTSNKLRHIRSVHHIKKNKTTDIRCVECDISYKHVNKLRDHLKTTHSLDMTEESLRFPNMNAFMKWKCDIERKNLCSYTLRHGSRKTLLGPKYFYMCHRSGKYQSKVVGERRRMLRVGGTCKMGIACTAAIYCQECPNEIVVRYIPHHYGHGKETSFVQLSPEEQTAIQESVSKGVPFEKLLDDIRDSQSKDTFQLFLLKKRDFRWINSAFKAQEYNPGISDAESVENWVRRCCQMEDSPILFYRQQNIGSDHEEFMLVIMTEFQKHILLSSSKEVVCVDSLYRRKGGRFYLTVMFVMDEFDNAFPVAFCISNKVDKNVIGQFFLSIKESTGNLSVKYFMSDSELYFYDSWVTVMDDEPRWLWCIWYVDNKIRTQLKIFKGNVAKRAEVYKTMRMLLECQNENVFTCMFKNFIDNLSSDPLTKNLGKFIMSKYGSNTELWASCYRKEVDLSTNIHLEVMHRTFRYCCREGRKKRLDKFLFVVMKLAKCKMLDRIANMLDEEKLNLAIEAIRMCHTAGLEVPAENMSSLSEKIWLIQTEGEEDPVYVTKELDKCPEHCSLRCEECDICVHQYSCTCVHSMIDANLCMHIHAVVWKFLTPHFSPAPSPSHSVGAMDHDDDDNADKEEPPKHSSDLYDSILTKTHDVYRKVKTSKCGLNNEALNSIMKRLDECIDICSGKTVEPVKDPPPATPNNTVYVINPYMNKPSPILPNQFPSAISSGSHYMMLLPNNGLLMNNELFMNNVQNPKQ